MLNFFLCFRSELATDEVVLRGTIRLDSKIRSQNVHFHDSFCREQTLATTKLFLSLTRIDFAVAVSSRAVRISCRPYAFFRPYYFEAYGSNTGPSLLRFLKEIAGAGPYGSYDKCGYSVFRSFPTGKY